MTVAAHDVALLRGLVAQWEQAHAAWDHDGTGRAGAQLVGAVEAILRQHDATETAGGGGQ